MNNSIMALICLTDGEARAAARVVYLNTKYTCQLISLATGTAIIIPGLESKEAEEIFTSLFAGSIKVGYAKINKLKKRVSVIASVAVTA